MQNLIQWSERQSRRVAPGVDAGAPNLQASPEPPEEKAPRPSAWLKAIGFIVIAAVAWVNLKTAGGLNLEFFYLLGCAVTGWAAGARTALVCAVISGTFLFIIEPASALPAWIVCWNSLVRLLAFASIGWLSAWVRRLTRDLTRIARLRTARLESELEDHKETAELLGEAMELFKQVTENITDVFWATDLEKKHIHYISPAFEQIWGRTCDSLCESPGTWVEGIHPQDRERVSAAMSTKQVNGTFDEEYRVVRPDGSLRWVHDRAFPVKDENGMVYRLVGIVEDITERKRTEGLLQAQRDVGLALSFTNDLGYALERLLEIGVQLEGVDCGGIYIMDQESGELHLKAHRGLSRTFIKRIEHYKSDATEARMARAGEIVYVRREQIPRNLEVLWGSEGLRALAVVPIQHKGAVLGMLNLGSYRQDEIPQKTRLGIEMIASQFAGAMARIWAEEQLRRSEAHLRTVIDTSPVALLAGKTDGMITFEGGQALAALGIQPGEHVGQKVADVYRDQPAILEAVRRALAGEEFISVFEFGPVSLELRSAPSRDENGAVIGFVSVATNVTDRFRLERQILEISDREQAHIGQDIHDGLCQQLVGIAFDANALEKMLVECSRAEAIAARRISMELDEAISESRRVSRGLCPVRLETEGLEPALKDLANSISERFRIRCFCKATSPEFECDSTTATHLYRIAQEAVNNAVKHSGARCVSIHLADHDGEIEMIVRDDGKGFEPGSTRTGGMGLYIMDYRARSIGGTVRVRRGSENGTVVTCRLQRKSP